jgi:hypothetical protein
MKPNPGASRRLADAAALSFSLALAAALVAPPPAAAQDLETALNARYRGGWVIVRVPVASDCGGLYTDNTVVGMRTDSKGDHRFEAGELARVEKVEVRMGGRVDLFLDLAEQLLAPYPDGPFTLYTPLSCRVQLELGAQRRAPVAEVEQALVGLVELHGEARGAEASPAWNGRRRGEYPEGYERTLAEHAAWKAEQVNLAVDARFAEAVEEATRISDRIREDPDYLAGFAAGVIEVRDDYLGDCPALLGAHIYPSDERGKSAAWNDGYADGQRLAFALELMRLLRGCYVPVPPPPA